MATPSNVIRVPKPPKTAYNPNRPLAKNTLLLNQVQHFHHMEQELREALNSGIAFESVQTEGQASEYIHKMTRILHPHVAHLAVGSPAAILAVGSPAPVQAGMAPRTPLVRAGIPAKTKKSSGK